jgi:hypothetical protein
MPVRSCAGCGHPEGDHKWNRSRTNPGHGVCLNADCDCREFEEVDRMSVIERCSWCEQPMDDRGYVREGERIDHADPCYGLRMRKERDDAQQQLRGPYLASRNWRPR